MERPTPTYPVFPLTALPDDSPAARLAGLYPQRQPGLWMQRVRILGGRLTGPQWRALAQAARRFSPQAPLHLTTRQDVEFHNVPTHDTLPLQHALAYASLTGLAAGGDGLRNITVCSCAQPEADGIDLFLLAQAVSARLLDHPDASSLPRKFKMALSCGQDNCDAQPWINDLGFVLRRHGDHLGFQVIAAGSLGARPATGILLYPWRPAADLLPIAHAALSVFIQHGDRQNRSRARLRHVRQNLGDAPFVKLIDQALAQTEVDPVEPQLVSPHHQHLPKSQLRLPFVLGDVSPDAAEALGRLADLPDTSLRITNHHRVIVLSPDQTQLRRTLAAEPALPNPDHAAPTIIACPGATHCRRALTDTRQIAERLVSRLQGQNLSPTAICISGCPNGCAHSSVAPIGLLGRLATTNGTPRPLYDLYLDGGLGRNPNLARLAASKLEPTQTLDAVTKLLLTPP